jgi:serine/threonine protein kinase
VSTSSEETRVVAGRYRLRSVLGSGSMGTVWSAYDEFLHRPVAVKEVRLPPGVPPAHADELRERTLREARAIAVLSHPNVIILHDVARENGEPFVVMELLPSRSLAHILRDHGPLSVEQAAAVGNAVAAALEAAHAAGITHRDVKPGNVLVAADGRIKLTDFGIARNVSEATMTRTGMMLGSPAYIAPEVASGGAVTTGADLWGLGATIFASVEGHPPYDADGDPLETVGLVVNGEVPQPSPGPLASVISALMAKEPTTRMSLRDVRQLLHPLQAKTPHDLFGAELFRTPDGQKTSAQLDPTDTQVIKVVAPPKKASASSSASSASAASSSESSSELASDPGPLPFMTSPSSTGSPRPVLPTPTMAVPVTAAARPASHSRGALAGVVLSIVAVLLFAAAAGGGFALARTIGQQPLTPPGKPPAAQPQAPPSQPLTLVQRSGDATNYNGTKGGLFTIKVPADWAEFVAQQPGSKLASNTVVQFVAPDGRRTVAVQRFADYFARYPSTDAYSEWLPTNWPRNEYVPIRRLGQAPVGGENEAVVVYNTIEGHQSASGAPLTRTTYAQVFGKGTSLWVVSVTVPVDQQGAGRTELFDQVAPTFANAD